MMLATKRKWFAWLTTLMVLTALPALAGFKVRCATLHNDIYLFLQDVAAFYGMQFSGNENEGKLRSTYSAIDVRLNHREIQFNGVKLNLSHGPSNWQNNLLIAERDFRRVFEPLLRPARLPAAPVRHIMLDPGHGGRDNGTRGKRYLEKDITLKVAQLTAAELRKAGFKVSLTRNDDQTLSLDQRGQIARKQGADLFVSLHTNYVANSSVNGIETFALAPVGTASTYSKSVSKTPSTGNRFDLLNIRLAYDVQRFLLTATQAPDRGIKRARFAVLRNAPCPAILVELGFMSNPTEENRLASPAYQDRLVRGIRDGILTYSKLVNK